MLRVNEKGAAMLHSIMHERRMAQAAMLSCKHSFAGVQLPLLGKILVSEGSNGTEVLVSSELYSPLLNLWTAAGSQQVPRTSFTNNPNNIDHAQVPRSRFHHSCFTVQTPHQIFQPPSRKTCVQVLLKRDGLKLFACVTMRLKGLPRVCAPAGRTPG